MSINTKGQLTNQNELEQILEAFPKDMSHAFGYGSGVFAQNEIASVKNQDDDNALPMIDLIFSTADAKSWHEENLKRNSDHYAVMPRILGAGFIEVVQTVGAGVYFNPMVTVGTASTARRQVKYGVTNHDALKKDLMEWDCMYVAGRMHKPIQNLVVSDEIMYFQQEYNLKYAVSTALLLFARKYEEEGENEIQFGDVFESIAGLSYTGDPRFAAGAEDPKKVQKLVNSKGQLDRFKSLYEQQLRSLQNMGVLSVQKNVVEVNLMECATRKVLYDGLPPRIQHDVSPELVVSPNKVELSCKALTESLTKIVGPPARIQSMKGLITAGLYKSVKYASAKLAKGALKGMI